MDGPVLRNSGGSDAEKGGSSAVRPDLPGSGQFNLMLIVTYDSMADLQPSKERYEAFMKKWGEAHQQQNETISEKYPDLREITGEYLMREITIK